MERRLVIRPPRHIILRNLRLHKIHLLRPAVRIADAQGLTNGIAEVDVILGEVAVESILRPALSRPLGSLLAIAGKLVLVTIVVGPLVNGDVVKGVDEEGLVLAEDGGPVDVALGDGLAMCVALLDEDVSRAR